MKPNKKNVQNIILEYIKKNGYIGLCNDECGCGCGLEDFMPCGEDCSQCEPALHKKWDEDEDCFMFFK